MPKEHGISLSRVYIQYSLRHYGRLASPQLKVYGIPLFKFCIL